MWNSFQTRYKVVKKIGEGSFSEVLQCEDRHTGINVAAKRLKKIYKSNEEILNCAELIASEKIKCHPNVLNLKEYFFDTFAGKIIFIFDLMDMSMYDYIKARSRCIPEQRVKRYLYQMLKGLDHLHRNGLFHRDIKPENILIKFHAIPTPVGPELIKIADLGSVRGTFSSPPYTEYISTRWYRSPECLLTVGFYGPKMDVWASGCVFFEMMTLRPLFPGKNEVDQLHRIHEILGVPSINVLKKLKNKSTNYMKFQPVKPKGLESVTCDFSDEAKQILKLMLQYDPDKRINVGRLLNNDYFEEFRSPRLGLNELPLLNHRNPADGWNTRKVVPTKHEYKSAERHRSHEGSKHHSKGSKESKGTPVPKLTSKTSIHLIKCCKQPNPNNYKLREKTQPLVDFKLLKSWGVNPNILRAVDPNKNRNEANKLKPKLQKRAQVDSFRKTTSNLPQMTKPLLQAKEMKYRNFQSQSFVVPWYANGPSKTDPIQMEIYRRSQIKRKLIRGT